MTTPTTPSRTREEHVRYLLRRLALEFTRTGTIEELASDMGLHPTTLYRYMSDGDMPGWRARLFERHYGKWAPAVELSKQESENSNRN